VKEKEDESGDFIGPEEFHEEPQMYELEEVIFSLKNSGVNRTVKRLEKT
jgi:hypothetical protein